MKRSENVGLVLMGGAAFAATFAAGMTFVAWQKPSHAAPQTAQSCVTQPDGTQNCQQSARRSGFVYYFYPTSWGWGSSREPARAQQAAFSGNTRSATSASYSSGASSSSGTIRNGFGSSAQGSSRVSAGG